MSLFVKIRAGADHYLLEALRVERIIPALEPRKIPGTPASVAGVIDYEGRPLPVLDLCELFVGRAAQRLLSTRLIVVRGGERQSVHTLQRDRPVGLLAEQVTDTVRVAAGEFLPAIHGEHTRFLGAMAATGGRFAQHILLDELLSPARLVELFGASSAAP
jgi:chemotaxis-related protein WspB